MIIHFNLLLPSKNDLEKPKEKLETDEQSASMEMEQPRPTKRQRVEEKLTEEIEEEEDVHHETSEQGK